MQDQSKTPLLDQVQSPSDMKSLSDVDLIGLADEVRTEVIASVSETGGHLGAGLGVVELTVALHAVFDAPKDRIIWDVSHQSYPHKILTAAANRCEPYAKGAVSVGSPNDQRAPMILSVLGIALPQFLLLWVCCCAGSGWRARKWHRRYNCGDRRRSHERRYGI